MYALRKRYNVIRVLCTSSYFDDQGLNQRQILSNTRGLRYVCGEQRSEMLLSRAKDCPERWEALFTSLKKDCGCHRDDVKRQTLQAQLHIRTLGQR